MIILDNYIYSFSNNINNGILIKNYNGTKHDC